MSLQFFKHISFVAQEALSMALKGLSTRVVFSQRTFMTPNEVEFYGRLQHALGDKFFVMCQVSMGALIDIGLDPGHPKYWESRLKFSSKICDYVLCRKSDLKPLLVIELDDRTHTPEKDRSRDNFLALSGLRTVRFQSKEKPSPSAIRRFIELELYKQSRLLSAAA